jgi:F420-dependent oxidoreductase-like protein
MDLRIFTEPQMGATYSDLLAVATASEDLGFDAFFRSDHYLTMGGDGLPGPTDAWTTLAGLARETSTIRLGTLVTSATFRHPGVLAIQVAQVDEMSGGRVELGLGAGWFAEEHAAYGIPFPAKRFGLLTEQLEVVTGLWGTPVGERFSYPGEHYTLENSPALPKPVQQSPLDPSRAGVPVIVGGLGPRRTPALAARFAAEFNLSFPPLAEIGPKLETVREACRTIGRDPGGGPRGRDRRHADRDRGPAGRPRRARHPARLPPGARPARPGPPGAGGLRGHAAAGLISVVARGRPVRDMRSRSRATTTSSTTSSTLRATSTSEGPTMPAVIAE